MRVYIYNFFLNVLKHEEESKRCQWRQKKIDKNMPIDKNKFPTMKRAKIWFLIQWGKRNSGVKLEKTCKASQLTWNLPQKQQISAWEYWPILKVIILQLELPLQEDLMEARVKIKPKWHPHICPCTQQLGKSAGGLIATSKLILNHHNWGGNQLEVNGNLIASSLSI